MARNVTGESTGDKVKVVTGNRHVGPSNAL